MINSCLIIDDDTLICDLLEHFCRKSGLVSATTSVQNCKDGLNLLSNENYDLIFLDFNLPDMTGRDFINMKSSPTPIIMVTSDPGFAAESYSYPEVVDYLIKPLSFERFLKALGQVDLKDSKSDLHTDKNIYIKEGHNLVRLSLPEVHYLKSEANYVSFITPERTVMTLASLSTLEAQLPETFTRTHRSYIVNTMHIDEVRTSELIVDGKSIPISPSYKEQLLKKLKLL